MSTLTSTTTTPVDDSARPTSRALQARRGFLIASPVLAGIGCVIGAYADPAVGLEGQGVEEVVATQVGDYPAVAVERGIEAAVGVEADQGEVARSPTSRP